MDRAQERREAENKLLNGATDKREFVAMPKDCGNSICMPSSL